MKYNHQFTVDAPLKDVAAFHRMSQSMAAITPPPLVVRIKSAPEILSDGDEMSFTIWAGPVPLNWTARIEQAGPNGFIDRQLCGPFATWVHKHIFVLNRYGGVTVVDEVEAELHRHPFWRLVGMSMWIGMPILFAFRQWKTKRILQSSTFSLTYAAERPVRIGRT